MAEAAVKLNGTLQAEATRLRTLKEAKDAAAKALKLAEAEYKEQERVMIDLMDEQGLEMTRVPGVATLTVTSQDVITATDWAEVYQFIEDNQLPHILQKRLSATAVKELQDQGVEVPGTQVFKKRGLSVRKA